MEKSRSSVLPLAVAAVATMLFTANTEGKTDFSLGSDPPAPSSSERKMRALTGLVHRTRAEIQQECSTDYFFFTDDAVESDYREEEEEQYFFDGVGMRFTRCIEIDDDRIECARRIIEVLNRRAREKFNAEITLGGWELTQVGDDPISAKLEAYSPPSSPVDI